MACHSFNDLINHVGHKIVCVGYGKSTGKDGKLDFANAAIECETCNEVLLDFDKEEN